MNVDSRLASIVSVQVTEYWLILADLNVIYPELVPDIELIIR
jgi:hypothetical protein